MLPAERCSYLLGNPPFVGKKEQSPEQKADVEPIFAPVKGGGVLDLVAAWYVKAAAYLRFSGPSPFKGEVRRGMGLSPSAEEPHPHPSPPLEGEGTEGARPTDWSRAVPTRCAFVSTNSITQGEQVGVLWGYLLAQGIKIHFAHRTFRWSNEASGKAAVHCVIVGFGLSDVERKVIYEYDDVNGAPHAMNAARINPYLVDAADCVLPTRKTPIVNVPEIREGSALIDDGNLVLSKDEMCTLIADYPIAAQWIRPFVGGEGFINREERYCIWLQAANPRELRTCPPVMAAIEKVREFRQKSGRAATNALANTPTLFGEIRQPAAEYIIVPKTSSERRRFVPMGFLSPDHVLNNTSLYVEGATSFHFGVMSSTMHFAWLRCIGGRLKHDYRYSNGIVYNNFPWPDLSVLAPSEMDGSVAPTRDDKLRTAIETAAQGVLDARAAHPESSLADLYDPVTMPPDLVKAHQKLDSAVDAAYYAAHAADGAKKTWRNDAERVAFLFTLYQKFTTLLPGDLPKQNAKRAAR